MLHGSPDARWLDFMPEVADAMDSGKPVVALETTILSHGLPWPINWETGRACEDAVRESGAIPATLGISDGRIRVGLHTEQMEAFCRPGHQAKKVNLSNMAAVITQGDLGSLTVAACLQVCSMARIPVFATGGIGGVHRGWTERPDISADLTALGRFPVLTVCAGAKSILDLPATLEVLETLGVPVLGWKTDDFPRFHTPKSDLPVDVRVEHPRQAAEIARCHWSISSSQGASGGIVLAVPVPAESSMAGDVIDQLIAEALAEVRAQGLTGRAVTPALLQWLAVSSRGGTLQANTALIRHNCAVAGQVALALSELNSL